MTTHFSYPPVELQEELKSIANAMATGGKGLLASDETAEYMEKRLGEVGVENTEETRRKYKQVRQEIYYRLIYQLQ